MHDDIRIPPLRLPAALASDVDDYRFAHRIPSRAEAIRRLLKAGVGQDQAKAAPPALLCED
jgi:hypothetical protein